MRIFATISSFLVLAALTLAQVSLTISNSRLGYGEVLEARATNNSGDETYTTKALFPGMIFRGSTLVYPINTSQLFQPLPPDAPNNYRDFSWDQKDSDGNQVPPGNYRLVVDFFYGPTNSQVIRKTVSFTILPPPGPR